MPIYVPIVFLKLLIVVLQELYRYVYNYVHRFLSAHIVAFPNTWEQCRPSIRYTHNIYMYICSLNRHYRCIGFFRKMFKPQRILNLLFC